MNLSLDKIHQLDHIIRRSLEELYSEDTDLLNRKGLEQSIAFRFGLYFYNLTRNIEWLSDLDLDMEYNKNGNHPKYIPSRGRDVRPDFILHSRGNNSNNVLIIEFKGWWDRRSRTDDRSKILDFTNSTGQYAYGLGIIIEFRRTSFSLELIENNDTLFI